MTTQPASTVRSPIITRCIREQLQSVWDGMVPDEHINHVDKLIRERRVCNVPAPADRRVHGRQSRGNEDWRDVDTAFMADQQMDLKE